MDSPNASMEGDNLAGHGLPQEATAAAHSRATVASEVVSHGSPRASGRRPWPAHWAFVMAWLRPGELARRTASVPLWQAYVVHLVCVLVAAHMIAGFVGWADNPSYGMGAFVLGIGQLYDEFHDGLVEQPVLMTIVIAASILAGEAIFLLVALLFAPWGARDERVRDSFHRAIYLGWLGTPHYLLAICLCGLVVVPVEQVRIDWLNNNDSPPWVVPTPAPRPPNAVSPNATPEEIAQAKADQEAFQKAQAEYWEAVRRRWDAWRASQPWYVRHNDALIFWIIMAAAAWSVRTWLRLMDGRPPAPVIERRPMCETCGYDLTGVHLEGRCPECGAAAESSLGEAARCGPPWAHRRAVGCLPAFRETVRMAMKRPDALGQTLRTTTIERDHRSFLLLMMPAFFAVVAGGALLIDLVARSHSTGFGSALDPEVLTMVSPGCGAATVLLLPIFFGLIAVLVAMGRARPRGRNLLSASIQAVVYVSPVYLIATTLFMGFIALIVHWEPQLRAWGRARGLGSDTLFVIPLVLFQFAAMGIFARQAYRAVSAAQFANR